MKQLEPNEAMAQINRAARTARRLCTTIIGQTSLKPYYNKVGGAALYADMDKSEEQRAAIASAVWHLCEATERLVDVAINGGTTQAQLLEIFKDDMPLNLVRELRQTK